MKKNFAKKIEEKNLKKIEKKKFLKKKIEKIILGIVFEKKIPWKSAVEGFLNRLQVSLLSSIVEKDEDEDD